MGLFKFIGEVMAEAAEEEKRRKKEEKQRKLEQEKEWKQELEELEEMRKIAISKGDIASKHEVELNISLVKAEMAGYVHGQIFIRQEIEALHGNTPPDRFNGVSVKFYDM